MVDEGAAAAELESLAPEERERVMAFARLRGALVLEFLEVLGEYVRMLRLEDFGAAGECAERLALQWRDVGERERLEQLGEQLLPEEGMQLLGALQSSLILASSGEAERRKLALGEREVAERTVLAGREGAWPDWEEAMRITQLERQQRYGGTGEVHVETPKRLSGKLLIPGRRKRHAVAVELSKLLEDELAAGAGFYTETLLPDGSRLDPRGPPPRASGSRPPRSTSGACVCSCWSRCRPAPPGRRPMSGCWPRAGDRWRELDRSSG